LQSRAPWEEEEEEERVRCLAKPTQRPSQLVDSARCSCFSFWLLFRSIEFSTKCV
jgi:hypothetical protein